MDFGNFFICIYPILAATPIFGVRTFIHHTIYRHCSCISCIMCCHVVGIMKLCYGKSLSNITECWHNLLFFAKACKYIERKTFMEIELICENNKFHGPK